mmetsp:Transcript_15698/g.32488  ORF Transcript_15698/g.32488 Transcript_15698/m.32488 type:complete len:113 (-) Transcript_15698:1409-1747(-)|eukprot:CAMPEP_0172471586 /NCGR_PEP_ID=MMETSP1065-20121228/67894_1 /TAXON_ID=265537 /ORGANISM="Amphiprora paludosa, Strain CCMP125" /LENGTH=112 /DNA_ID=CAMNT_0013229689 /DNA_START=67 /DNA_END=402 /DNA_ORIENTATION=-
MNSSMTRCSVSSLSLSAMSISSDDGSAATAHQSSFHMQSNPSTSSLRKSFGSHACHNLAALATSTAHHQTAMVASAQPQQQQAAVAGDEWGYFVDTTERSSSTDMEDEQPFW